MHKVSANYTLPTVLNTLQPVAMSGLELSDQRKNEPYHYNGNGLQQQWRAG